MTLWDYPGNFSGGLEVNSTGTLMQYLDYASGNHLGIMLLIAMGAIMFLSLKAAFSTIKALNAAIVLIFLLSIPLAMMQIFTWTGVALFGLVAILVTLMMRSDSQMGL